MKFIKKIVVLTSLFLHAYTYSSEKYFFRNKKIVSHIPFSKKLDKDFTSTLTTSSIIVDEKIIAARKKRTQDMAELSWHYQALKNTKKASYPLYGVDSAYLVNQIVQRTKKITAVLKQV